MMDGYLGDFEVDIETTSFAGYSHTDWAMEFISRYGQIDGEHHKTWVLDQVARILQGTPVVLVEARWANGHSEYRFWTADDPSGDYQNWVEEMLVRDAFGDPQYSYDTGIAP